MQSNITCQGYLREGEHVGDDVRKAWRVVSGGNLEKGDNRLHSVYRVTMRLSFVVSLLPNIEQTTYTCLWETEEHDVEYDTSDVERDQGDQDLKCNNLNLDPRLS